MVTLGHEFYWHTIARGLFLGVAGDLALFGVIALGYRASQLMSNVLHREHKPAVASVERRSRVKV
jgi:hypothetical protein